MNLEAATGAAVGERPFQKAKKKHLAVPLLDGR